MPVVVSATHPVLFPAGSVLSLLVLPGTRDRIVSPHFGVHRCGSHLSAYFFQEIIELISQSFGRQSFQIVECSWWNPLSLLRSRLCITRHLPDKIFVFHMLSPLFLSNSHIYLFTFFPLFIAFRSPAARLFSGLRNTASAAFSTLSGI